MPRARNRVPLWKPGPPESVQDEQGLESIPETMFIPLEPEQEQAPEPEPEKEPEPVLEPMLAPIVKPKRVKRSRK